MEESVVDEEETRGLTSSKMERCCSIRCTIKDGRVAQCLDNVLDSTDQKEKKSV